MIRGTVNKGCFGFAAGIVLLVAMVYVWWWHLGTEFGNLANSFKEQEVEEEEEEELAGCNGSSENGFKTKVDKAMKQVRFGTDGAWPTESQIKDAEGRRERRGRDFI